LLELLCRRFQIYAARLRRVVELDYLSQLRLQGGVPLAQKTVCVAQDVVLATQCVECGADINR